MSLKIFETDFKEESERTKISYLLEVYKNLTENMDKIHSNTEAGKAVNEVVEKIVNEINDLLG